MSWDQDAKKGYEGFNNGDPSVFDQMCAPDCTFIAYTTEDESPVTGWDALLQKIAPVMEAHPQRLQPVHIASDEDAGWGVVVARIEFEDGSEPMYELHMSRIRDGKIVEFKGVPFDYDQGRRMNRV
jgi:ketosteroid isomerase-like protein